MWSKLQSIPLLLVSLPVSIALWALTACIVIPVRVPESTKNSLGNQEQLNFSLLKPGATTRNDVIKDFGAIDTGVHERFFWGRWQSSKWLVVAGSIGGGGGDRVWNVRNVLIQFDSNDTVSDWAIVGDSELDKRLDLLDEHTDSLLNLPRASQAETLHANALNCLVLKEDSIEYTCLDSSLTAARTNIDKLTSASVISRNGDPAKLISDTKIELHARLHFSVPVEFRYLTKKKKAKVFKTRSLDVMLDPPDYLQLRRYFWRTTHSSQPTADHPLPTRNCSQPR